MNTRRDFLKVATGTGLALAAGWRESLASTASAASQDAEPTGSAHDRGYWIERVRRLSRPVLESLAERRLRVEMPVEAADPARRAEYSHLEAVGRLLAGLAPWLELPDDGTAEAKERAHWAELARRGIAAGTDPDSPDFFNFTRGGQPLVDAAFLAQAMLRAPTALWQRLEPAVQRNVIAALVSTRPIKAGESNWKLFSTTVEVFLHRVGEKRDETRLFEGIQRHEKWYLGDGTYGDGPEWHWDYYNSFVIQPMLVEALDVVGDESAELGAFRTKANQRLTRWAAVQERMIAADGSFPPLGRSIAYRCGAFQGLALAALRRSLPAEVSPAQARVALTRVIRRTLEAPGTWDERGWLRLGLAGHQPALAEGYISTGSLYLCSFAFLPLGLPPSDAFWVDRPVPTTWERIWAGENLPADKAIK